MLCGPVNSGLCPEYHRRAR